MTILLRQLSKYVDFIKGQEDIDLVDFGKLSIFLFKIQRFVENKNLEVDEVMKLRAMISYLRHMINPTL